MNPEICYIGMDLGTYKTAVVCSNGRRDAVTSVVGWPRDMIARSLLGRDTVVGEEVFENRRALESIRPFAHGALKYVDHQSAGIAAEDLDRHRRAARLLVEHAVSRVRPSDARCVFGAIGAPSQAGLASRQFILEAAATTFDAALIVHEPFAVAYGMHRLRNTLVVDIGAGTTDICPMFGAYPTELDQLTVPVGGDGIDRQFRERLSATYPEISVTDWLARQIKERHGSVRPRSERIVITLPVDGRPREYDVTEALHDACQSIVPPIVEGIRAVVARIDSELQPGLRDNILLAGGGSQLVGLDLIIEQGLQPIGGGKVTRVQDAMYAGAFGALKLALEMPPEQWSRVVPAVTRAA